MKKLLIVINDVLFFVAGSFGSCAGQNGSPRQPNIVFILVDQWRAQATGYSGDKNAITPNLDRLASVSLNLKNAISGMPVCTPFRASLMTGQYPLTHGLFMNDILLDTSKTTIAKIYRNHGYNTGFIGKWHIDGNGRSSYIPEERRQGFEYWKALECTHNYNESAYYSGNSEKKLFWEGYDAMAQADDASKYIAEHAGKNNPFLLMISMGTPHEPYHTAPEAFRKIYDEREIRLNENVPVEIREKVRRDLKGYYAHITATDEAIARIWQTVKDSGIEDNTIIVFTADHGDLLGAHGSWKKQQPYEESIRVPFLLHYPAVFGRTPTVSNVMINSPDIMPTLLGLSDIQVPESVEGIDFSQILKGNKKNTIGHTLISCVQPFGQWSRKVGGREFRGVVTDQYTYVRDLNGPWLMFDNLADPFQLDNLIGNEKYARIQKKLNKLLVKTLKERNDDFKPGMDYVRKWNYVVDETETIPYRILNYQGKAINE
jgi:arylsulfatase A-like enzyme